MHGSEGREGMNFFNFFFISERGMNKLAHVLDVTSISIQLNDHSFLF